MKIEILLNKLKKPSVVMGLVSEIVGILVLLSVTVDANLITTVTATICSILVTLGIMSNPNTKNKGFGDDIYICEECNKEKEFTMVAGELVCITCGTSVKKDGDTKLQ